MVKKWLAIITILGLLMACSDEENETNNNQISDNMNDREEKVENEIPENDNNQSNSKEVNETSMDLQTGYPYNDG